MDTLHTTHNICHYFAPVSNPLLKFWYFWLFSWLQRIKSVRISCRKPESLVLIIYYISWTLLIYSIFMTSLPNLMFQSILSQNPIFLNWIMICLMWMQKLAISNFNVTMLQTTRKDQPKKKHFKQRLMSKNERKTMLYFRLKQWKKRRQAKEKDQKRFFRNLISQQLIANRLPCYNLLAENEILHNWKSISKKSNQLDEKEG